ncbi:30S ribosomal protein S2 [Candidatus Woesebacteria bacterium]|nr:30S ribosomal protein S2 [Candidatus Woesebacteria bacterium]
MAVKISLKQLLEAGAHFGHQAKRWNPKMAPYLYGTQEGVHVFDLLKTKSALEEALEAIKTAVAEGKVILLLGSKKQAREKIIEIGTETAVPYVSERWLGGTLTKNGGRGIQQIYQERKTSHGTRNCQTGKIFRRDDNSRENPRRSFYCRYPQRGGGG